VTWDIHLRVLSFDSVILSHDMVATHMNIVPRTTSCSSQGMLLTMLGRMFSVNLVNLLNTFRGNLSLELMRFINYTEGLDGHLYNDLLGW